MKNIFQLLIDGWRERASLGDGAKHKNLAEFMPAALELQETPPNPIVRWLAWTLMSLFVLVILWAWFGEVDVVVSAEGKVIPSSRVKQVQSFSKGLVKAIYVKEGQFVDQGQPLIELDSTITSADYSRIRHEFDSAHLGLAAAETLHHYIINPESQPKDIDSIHLALEISKDNLDIKIIKLYEYKIWSQLQQYQSELSGITNSMRSIKEEKSSLLKNIKTERDLNQLAVHKRKLQQLDQAENDVDRKIRVFNSGWIINVINQMTDIRNKIAHINEELIKAKNINNKQTLYAPVSGYVQQLEINTIGAVVSETQQLMIIVPNDEELEVQALLSNQDIGFVKKEMPAEIKVHAFPFTKYGLINARIVHISEDAIVDKKNQLSYAIQLKIHRNETEIDSNSINPIPGMAVTVEIKVSQRKIIDYFLSPLLKVKQESIREM